MKEASYSRYFAKMIATDVDSEREYEDAIVKYGGIITKICYYFSTDTEEFKDLRQEVLINLWRGWADFRGDSKLSSWIYRISFNTCVSFQRKENKKKKTISIEEVIDLPAHQESSKLQQYNEMHRLIRQLSYEDRAIILMWLDEKSYEEISELMGINRNTIAVRLKRIKEKLVKMAKQG